ncbi:MAG: hypothetical protein V8S57_02590 [Oscillospiraceae bacterium]
MCRATLPRQLDEPVQLRTATGAQSGVAVTVDATDPAVGTVVLAGRSIDRVPCGCCSAAGEFGSATVTLYGACARGA